MVLNNDDIKGYRLWNSICIAQKYDLEKDCLLLSCGFLGLCGSTLVNRQLNLRQKGRTHH